MNTGNTVSRPFRVSVITLLGATLFSLGACERRRQLPFVAAAASASAAQIRLQPTEAGTSENLSADTFAATLTDGELYSCAVLSVDLPADVAGLLVKVTDAGAQAIVDSELSVWLSGGSSMLADSLDKKSRGASKALTPNGASQALKKPCGEQFSRKSLATCLVNISWEPSPKLRAVPMTLGISYFQIPEDTVMTACIAAGGEWGEVPRDSSSYLLAKSQASGRRFLRMTGQK